MAKSPVQGTRQPADKVRLLLAHRLFAEGARAAAHADDLAHVTAVVLLHLAVETIVKTVLDAKGAHVDPRAPFHQVASAAEKFLPDLNRVAPLTDIRNAAVHAGTVPGRGAVQKSVERARTLLGAGFAAVDEDFATFSVANLVQNPDVRRALDDAIRLVAESKCTEATACASLAFWYLRNRLSTIAEQVLDVRLPKGGAMFSKEQEMRAVLESLVAGLAGLAMGFDFDERGRFVEITGKAGGASYSASGKLSVVSTSIPISATDATWCIEYVAGHAFRLEQVYPSLKAERTRG